VQQARRKPISIKQENQWARTEKCISEGRLCKGRAAPPLQQCHVDISQQASCRRTVVQAPMAAIVSLR